MTKYEQLASEPSTMQKFWHRVSKQGSDCWHWTAGIDTGYGVFTPRRYMTVRAHRLSYVVANGPLSPWLYVDHLCHNADPTCPGGAECLHRRCVNPDHLEAVTPRASALSSDRTTASLNAAKVACPASHPFSDENTYVRPDGGRECRTCRAARVRAFKQARRVA